MKILLSHKLKQLASALIATFAICAIFSLFIVYYLSLTEQQTRLGFRAQAWNMAIAITEAGVEEGLQHLNSNYGNLGADGWTYDGSTFYWRSNTLADGNSYAVFLSITNSFEPVILAKAYVNPPTLAQSAGESFFATVPISSAQSMRIARAVRVTCGRSSLYGGALIVKRDIDLNGNGVYTDSYNSQDPAKSTGGKYDPNKYSGDRGDIATNGSITNSSSVSIGNANIYGRVHLGPNCSISYGPNGGVGPHGAQGRPAPGWVVNDANFTFPDTSLPNTTGWPVPPSGLLITRSNLIASTLLQSTNYPAGGASGTNALTYDITGPTTSCLFPTPPGTIVLTNWAVSSYYPSSVPPGGVTAYCQTNWTSSSSYPLAGTYLGTPSKHGNKWEYWAITGTNYSYPTFTYKVPTSFLYSYYAYTTNVVESPPIFYDHMLFGGTNYVTNSLVGKTITLGADATLVMPGGINGSEDFSFVERTGATAANVQYWYALRSGSGFTPTNQLTVAQLPTLLLKVGGTSANVAGNRILNPSGYAASFIVWCAPSVTSFAFSGNGEFTGVFVAPNANLSLNGGGNNAQDFCGSIMARSAKINGHFSFHWDESLETAQGNGRFLATSWNEIPPF